MRAGSDEEIRLYRRLCSGDVSAFEELCLRLEGPVLGYLTRLVGASDAEDLAQEAFLRVYGMACNGRLRRDRASPRALLFTVAHNLAVDFLRKAGHAPSMPPRPSVSAARSAEQGLLRAELDKALARLPDNHREALLLREFGELSYNEIARTLDVDVGRVKVWIYRARTRLAGLLDRDGQFVGETTGEKDHGD